VYVNPGGDHAPDPAAARRYFLRADSLLAFRPGEDTTDVHVQMLRTGIADRLAALP
jgi:hypothetical protein